MHFKEKGHEKLHKTKTNHTDIQVGDKKLIMDNFT